MEIGCMAALFDGTEILSEIMAYTYISQCQIGLLFFTLHYFHSFRDDLGVKKSNFFTNKSVQFLC